MTSSLSIKTVSLKDGSVGYIMVLDGDKIVPMAFGDEFVDSPSS